MNLRFFDLAKKISKLSNHTKFKLGCVIVKGSKIVSVGTNNIKTHPKAPHPFFSLHCEVAAILAARQDLSGCEIYVYREIKNGTPALAKPCIYCLPFIKESGIKETHYSIKDGFETRKI
jgi:deoxycytidylate deaminase